MSHWTEKLTELRACCDAVEWARDYDTPQAAWKACERGDWMLWLLGRICKTEDQRKALVLCACDCAEPALKYVGEGEERPRLAIEAARAWTRDEATIEQVRTAANAAYAYAAAAASAAAYAAYAYAAYAFSAAASASASWTELLKASADIVRRHYPVAPKMEEI